MEKSPELLLENQLCFRIYTLQRSVMALYKPLLDSLNLTYLQYITMLVLWEKDQRKVGEICDATHLDVGTISPMLKRIEKLGFIERKREEFDERVVLISLTDKGKELKQKALSIPHTLSKCFVEVQSGERDYSIGEISSLFDSLIDTFSSNIKRKK